MEFLSQIGLFASKLLLLLLFIAAIVAIIAAANQKDSDDNTKHLKIKKLNDKYQAYRDKLEHQVFDKKALKTRKKAEKKLAKEKQKNTAGASRPRVYVIDFHGDIAAKQNESLRETVTAILTVATPIDQVVVKLESPGGMVNAYGFAASQLERFRERNIPLTVCVDKVAASGGYMMAAVANTIIAAPCAYIGSIGVISQMPNFHRWLKKHNIDFEQITAGDYKRTVTVFGENTNKDRAKYQQELEQIHDIFKAHIQRHRPQVDLTQTATGEHWLAIQALELGLIDKLQTSDDFLLSLKDYHDLYQIKYKSKENMLERCLHRAQTMLTRTY